MLFILVCYLCSCNSLQSNGKQEATIKELIKDTTQISQYGNAISEFVSQQDTIKKLEEIANKIENELKKYSTIKKVVFGYSTEGSDLTGYYDENKNIKKILVRHAGENGNLTEHYYFANGLLVLVHTKNVVYDQPISQSNATTESAFIEEFSYFYKGVLLKWTSQFKKIKDSQLLGLLNDKIKQTNQNNEVIKNDNNYLKQSQDLIKYSEDFIRSLSK